MEFFQTQKIRRIVMERFEEEILKAAMVTLGVAPASQFKDGLFFSGGRNPVFSRDRIIDKLASRPQDGALLAAAVDHGIDRVFRSLVLRGKSESKAMEELAGADEVVFSVHQTRSLQGDLNGFLDEHPELSRVPWVSLVAPEYDPISQDYRGQSSLVRLSQGGEVNLPVVRAGKLAPVLRAKKVHLVGGFCNDCLLRTAQEVSQHVLESRSEVEIILHPRMIYGGESAVSLTKLEESDELDSVTENIRDDLEMDSDSSSSPSSWDAFMLAMHEATLSVFDGEATGERVGPDAFRYRRNEDGKTIVIRYARP
jgi:hypothetical protein